MLCISYKDCGFFADVLEKNCLELYSKMQEILWNTQEGLHHGTGNDSLGSKYTHHSRNCVSDNDLTTILLIVSPNNSEIYPIAFHSQTFPTLELNYDIHNKELLLGNL